MGLIRFLLACGVILYHTTPIMGYSPVAGILAVQCFFIISGFYMALILDEKYVGKGSTYLFYSNRALKIYPLYLVILVLMVAWSVVVHRLHYPGTLDYYTKYSNPSLITLSFLVITNVVIIGLDSLFFLGINKQGNLYWTADFTSSKPNLYNFAFNLVAWSIAVELIFYLLAPWLTRRNIYSLLLMLILSLGCRIILAQLYSDVPPWSNFFVPTQIMFFIAGIISYRIYLYYKKMKIPKYLQFILYAIFLLIIIFYYQFLPESYFKNILLFLSTMVLMPVAFRLCKKNKFDSLVGNLSYAIYISQFLIREITSAKRFPKIINMGFTTLLVTIVFAIIMDSLVTRYVENFRKRRMLLFIARQAK